MLEEVLSIIKRACERLWQMPSVHVDSISDSESEVVSSLKLVAAINVSFQYCTVHLKIIFHRSFRE